MGATTEPIELFKDDKYIITKTYSSNDGNLQYPHRFTYRLLDSKGDSLFKGSTMSSTPEEADKIIDWEMVQALLFDFKENWEYIKKVHSKFHN